MSFESLTAEFAQEALTLLEALERLLLGLEHSEPGETRDAQVAAIRRSLHTLKGNAGLVGAVALQSALHVLEDHAEGLTHSSSEIRALLAGLDVVRSEAKAIGAGRSVAEASEALQRLAGGVFPGSDPGEAGAPEVEGELRLPQARMDELIAAAGHLCVLASQLHQATAAKELPAAVRELADHVDAAARGLHEQVLRARMVPARRLLSRFERLVRDEAERQGKRARLRVAGAEVEIDKALLDGLSGALVHLVRNAVVHGIEAPEQRRLSGKPEVATVTLAASVQGSRVSLVIEDDGRGLDRTAVAGKAAALGLDPSRPAEELIFEPGFSTAQLSEAAGRGVGLDAVRRAISTLGGSVDVESEPGRGTRFTLVVPASIALQRVLLVEVEGETYALPLSSVVEATRLTTSTVRWLGKGAAAERNGSLVPLVDSGRLGLGAAQGAFAVFLAAGGNAALRVDALRGQQDFVFQPLDPGVRGRAPVSGAALMGDGRVILRLDPELLVAAARPADWEVRT